ncbi:hypothetical protein ACM66B_003989 [Microbotryomycetes sp. NB124-2]
MATGKPSLLRKIVTGVHDPVSATEHATRWHKNSTGQMNQQQQQQSRDVGGRVASMVNQFEQASLSGRQQSLQHSTPPRTGLIKPLESSSSSHNYERSPSKLNAATATDSRPSSATPTVPAALFQKQAQQSSRCTPPSSPARSSRFTLASPTAIGAAAATTDKENRRTHVTDRPLTHVPDARVVQHHPSADSDAGSSSNDSHISSALTMATRNSDSTHASSLVTQASSPVAPYSGASTSTASDLEVAVLGVADKVRVELEASRIVNLSRDGLGDQLVSPPRILETAPTPQKREDGRHRDLSTNPSPLSSPRRPSPAMPAVRRQVSTFSEDLPPSPPLQQVLTPDLEQRFSPLPLDTPRLSPPTGLDNASGQPLGRRARASTVGADRRPFVSPLQQPQTPEARSESFEERTIRIESAFATLLDSMQLPDRSVRDKMLQLSLTVKEEMVRSSEQQRARQKSSPVLGGEGKGVMPFKPTHRRGRSLMGDLVVNTTPIQRSPVQIDETTGDAILWTTSKNGGTSPLMSTTPKSSKFAAVRKTKSTTSLRPASAVAVTSSKLNESDDCQVNKSTTSKRPRHTRTRSGSSLFRSLGKAAGLPFKDSSDPSSPILGSSSSSSTEQLESVQWWAKRIQFANCAILDPREVGRLRGRLRNERPKWVREFVKLGGYKGLLMRLKELLEVEWREEQHDDQVLHELLRCFKALTLTAAGRRALASYSPSPFASFADLLFSEKRPGDLPSRQLLVELLQALYDVRPAQAQPVARYSSAWKGAAVVRLDDWTTTTSTGSVGSNGSGSFQSSDGSHTPQSGPSQVRRYTRKAKAAFKDSDASSSSEDDDDQDGSLSPSTEAEKVRMTHLMVHSLVQGPVDEKEENRVEFMKNAHKVRRFNVWVKEMSDVVRDYFWIFCHSQNLIWTLEQVDVDAVERPKVPSGMTGGVEYEAMAYAAAHFQLVNAIARNCASTEEAFQFHNDLFESGFERVLLTLRRASTTYYPMLHLELSRYVALARSVRFNLGPRILSCIDARSLRPEERMVVQVAQQRAAATAAAQQQQQQAPQLGALQFS